MPRYHNINGERVQFTAEEEAARDAEEAAWEAGALGRAQANLRSRRNQLLAETDFYALSDVTMSSDMETYNLANPTFPVGDSCTRQDTSGSRLYSDTESVQELQNNLLQQYENKFNMFITEGGSDKHQKINCLMGMMLENIERNYSGFNQEADVLEQQLLNEKKYLDDQEKVLKSNEDSELVSDYRNQSNEKMNKKLNTEFTIYVSMIVIFLIIEGIVFFV